MPRPMSETAEVPPASIREAGAWSWLPLCTWAAGAVLLACHVAAGAAAWRAWGSYVALSGLAGMAWAWHGHARRRRLTAVLRGHGWVQATAALALAAWQPSLAWPSALLWFGAVAWLPWDTEREPVLHLPPGQLALLCAMLPLVVAVVVARPVLALAPGSVSVRLLWLAGMLLPLVTHGLVMWLALGRLQRHYGHGLAQLARQCDALSQEVLQLQARVSGLQHSSGRDALTGVSSFERLMESVDALRERHARKPEPFCVVLLALDPWVAREGVPSVPWAPPLQDRVLLMLSGLLTTHLRAVDGIGRYRGDIFMLVMPDTSCEQAVWALQRLRHGMRQHPGGEASDRALDKDSLTLTLAVAQFQPGETSQRLVQRAEAALVQGHACGRNQIVIAEDVKPPDQS